MTPATTPTRLNLKKDEKLDVTWQDGHTSTYSIAYLRTMCPCAVCRRCGCSLRFKAHFLSRVASI